MRQGAYENPPLRRWLDENKLKLRALNFAQLATGFEAVMKWGGGGVKSRWSGQATEGVQRVRL